MWLKAVSRDQALSIGINIFIGEQMYQKFQKVFWDKTFTPVISHAYTGHHQISCAILQYGGENN